MEMLQKRTEVMAMNYSVIGKASVGKTTLIHSIMSTSGVGYVAKSTLATDSGHITNYMAANPYHGPLASTSFQFNEEKEEWDTPEYIKKLEMDLKQRCYFGIVLVISLEDAHQENTKSSISTIRLVCSKHNAPLAVVVNTRSATCAIDPEQGYYMLNAKHFSLDDPNAKEFLHHIKEAYFAKDPNHKNFVKGGCQLDNVFDPLFWKREDIDVNVAGPKYLSRYRISNAVKMQMKSVHKDNLSRILLALGCLEPYELKAVMAQMKYGELMLALGHQCGTMKKILKLMCKVSWTTLNQSEIPILFDVANHNKVLEQYKTVSEACDILDGTKWALTQ